VKIIINKRPVYKVKCQCGCKFMFSNDDTIYLEGKQNVECPRCNEWIDLKTTFIDIIE